MGCANAKPEVHTKKPPLNSNSNINPSQPSQQVQNQVIKLQPIPTGKQNSVPMQQPNLYEQQNQKSNLSDIQKNPYFTRQQVKQQLKNKQQQFKNAYQTIPVRQVTNSPPKTNNIQLEKSPQLQKLNPQQTKQLTVLNQNNGTPSRQHLKKSNEKHHVLSTINQGKQESQFTKQVQPSFLAVDKKDDLRISNSIFSSGTPRMDDNCMVSYFSRPTQSPLKTIVQEQKVFSRSEVKVDQKYQPLRQHTGQKQKVSIVYKEQGSIIKQNKESEVLKNSHLGKSNISNKSNNNNLEDKSGSGIRKQSNQITTDEIKVNVLSDKKGVVQQQMNNDDELIIPTEQNFQLGCTFEINNLIIDMNKVVW